MSGAKDDAVSGMGRILIVEDHRATLSALRVLFQARGWEVSDSRTAAGAVGLLEPPPAWIVLDLGLSDGDGEEFLRLVRERRIPSRVIVVSGLLDPERVERLVRLKPEAIRAKPIAFAELEAICRGGRCPAPPALAAAEPVVGSVPLAPGDGAFSG
jgi:DNA-binding NarL/FixJ family response regulator